MPDPTAKHVSDVINLRGLACVQSGSNRADAITYVRRKEATPKTKGDADTSCTFVHGARRRYRDSREYKKEANNTKKRHGLRSMVGRSRKFASQQTLLVHHEKIYGKNMSI